MILGDLHEVDPYVIIEGLVLALVSWGKQAHYRLGRNTYASTFMDKGKGTQHPGVP